MRYSAKSRTFMAALCDYQGRSISWGQTLWHNALGRLFTQRQLAAMDTFGSSARGTGCCGSRRFSRGYARRWCPSTRRRRWSCRLRRRLPCTYRLQSIKQLITTQRSARGTQARADSKHVRQAAIPMTWDALKPTLSQTLQATSRADLTGAKRFLSCYPRLRLHCATRRCARSACKLPK